LPSIETLYVVNHSHTDIGFTDHQDVCLRQHREYVDDALALIEATADRPEESRYRWTVEVTGPLLPWLREAAPSQLERFRHWHGAGAIDVAAMQYNVTPLLNVEQLCRSLYPVRILREEYGLTVRAAMQCDVNGVSWLFADLLSAIGVEFLTMSVNEVRGRAPRPVPGAFWWDGPGGGRVLAWNGFHYLFGRSIAKLGDQRFVDRALPPILEQLAARDDYPFDFLYCQSTHPMRVDNGPPDRRMADFVHRWNEEGRSPRIVLTTPGEFGAWFSERYGDGLETRRGDWVDWWSDGVASSAYETGVNRTTHELLLGAELLAAWVRAEGGDGWDPERTARAYEQATLYDEHTWGAFASIAAPDSLFTKAQWNRKSSFAYHAAMETHDVLARAARAFADRRGDRGTEGRFNLGELTDAEAYPKTEGTELLVVNTLPWSRSVLVEEPDLRGGGAPVGMLEQFFPPNVPWGGALPHERTRRVRAELAGFGFAFVSADEPASSHDLSAGDGFIENARYRVEIDAATGAVASWLDKELGHDFAGEQDGFRLGQLVYETVDADGGRDALFVMDFSRDDFGIWQVDPAFRREPSRAVSVREGRVHEGVAEIEVDVEVAGSRAAHCRYALESGRGALAVEWTLDKEHVTEPEAVYVAFPLALDEPSFRLDLNGVPCTPDADQLNGTVRDWYPVRRWADVSDGERGVTICPLDAPLVQLGGITTGKAASELRPEGPALFSWALNNHWMVNFKASQGGRIPLRYRLTTHAGGCDDAAAGRFAAEEATPPIVLRDYVPRGSRTGRLVAVDDPGVEMTAKPAEDGDGVVVRLHDVDGAERAVELHFEAATPASACRVSPVEEDGEPLELAGRAVRVPLGGRGVTSLRVRFGPG
jgi:alpha-mannosidase